MLLSSVSPQAQRKRCEKGEKGTAHPYIVTKTHGEKTKTGGLPPVFFCADDLPLEMKNEECKMNVFFRK